MLALAEKHFLHFKTIHQKTVLELHGDSTAQKKKKIMNHRFQQHQAEVDKQFHTVNVHQNMLFHAYLVMFLKL